MLTVSFLGAITFYSLALYSHLQAQQVASQPSSHFSYSLHSSTMSSPRTIRAGLQTISEVLKSPTTSKHCHTTPSKLTMLSHSHSRSLSTGSATSPTATTSPIDAVHTPPSSPTNSKIAPASSPAPTPHGPRTRTISHSNHPSYQFPTPSAPAQSSSRTQMVSIYDRPAWSSEPREASIVDVAAAETRERHYGHGHLARGRKRHPPMTIYTYDGPSCPN